MIDIHKKYKTRDGRRVELDYIATKEPDMYCVYGTVHTKDEGWVVYHCWTLEGGFSTSVASHNLDLIEVEGVEVQKTEPETKEDTVPQAKRYNSGKPRLSLIPHDALLEEGHVWTKGAEKYGDYNWEKLWGDKTVGVVLDSMLRHINEIQKGNHIDSESGKHHGAHIRCNAAMLIRYYNQFIKGK